MPAHPFALPLHALFRDHHRWLTSRLLRQADDRPDAEDVCSEAFVQVVAARTDPTLIRHPRAFLLKIGQRVLYRRWRERELEARIIEALALAAPEAAPSSEELMVLAQSLIQLDEALFGLPGPVREAFLYSQLDGLGYEEIGRRLGISTRTVARHVKQALHCCWTHGYF